MNIGFVLTCCSPEPDHNDEHASGVHNNSEEMASVFSALSNPARIDILKHIAQHRHCGCKDITQVLPLAQSTISQHLKVLIGAGIVTVENIPPRSRYQINEALMKDIALTTSTFLDSCCEGSCC